MRRVADGEEAALRVLYERHAAGMLRLLEPQAREADIGVASGNGKGQIFVRGEVTRTVPESQIVEVLIEEAMKLATEMGIDLSEPASGGGAVVTVH